MAKIISFINNKGGVGKTTSAVNVAAELAVLGHKVLLVDMDRQGDATYSFDLGQKDVEKGNIAHAILKPELTHAVRHRIGFEKGGRIKFDCTLDILPSHNESMGRVEKEFYHLMAGEKRLGQALEHLEKNLENDGEKFYDFIVIDCPPDANNFCINALTASDYYVLTVQPEPLSMKAVAPNFDLVKNVKEHLNPNLERLGILITIYERNLKIHNKIYEGLKAYFPGDVFTTTIPKNVDVKEVAGKRRPLCAYAPSSSGGKAYTSLTKEIIEKISLTEGV